MGLAHAHASLVASSALRLPPRLRVAGLDYHERAVASRALATKLRGTALLVLEMIDDLKAALDARNADAAREVLGAVMKEYFPSKEVWKDLGECEEYWGVQRIE